MGIVRIDYDDTKGRKLLVRLPAGTHRQLAEAAAAAQPKPKPIAHYVLEAIQEKLAFDQKASET